MKLTVSFFDRRPSCPTDRAPSPFFGFVLFVLFIYFFLFSFRSCPIAQQPSESFPCGQISTFSLLSLPFLGSDCVFPVLPLHPLRTSRAGFDGSSSTTISSQRWRHKRSPSSDPLLAEVFMIIFGNMDDLHKFSNDFFRPPNTEWPKQGLLVDSLFLISFSCWERDEQVEEGDGEKKNETASIGCRFCRCRPLWRRKAQPEARVPVLRHSNALS